MARLLALIAFHLCVAAAKRPHIVVLVLDDVGWADVGYHGGNFPTPNIDSLVKSGVELNRMYVLPQCSPTRSAIMTGRHAHKTGLQHFQTIFPGSAAGIPKDVPTMAETFKAGGYATHMIGKWHLGYSSWSQTPIGRGFDSHYGYLQGQTNYYNRTMPSCAKNAPCMFKVNKDAHSPLGDQAEGYDFWDNKKALTEDLGKYTVDAYEHRLESILEPYASSTPPEKPLFLYYAEQQLHIPLQPPPEAKHLEACRDVVGGSATVNRTILCSMASRLDQTIGHLVDSLKKNGMWDNTLIFALSDNGGMTLSSNIFPFSASSNWPLRGGKTTVFEGGVRSVSFVNGGALSSSARGTKVDSLLHAVDILPTLASFAGIPLLKQDLCDGLDAWSVITTGASIPRTDIPINIGVNPLGGFGGFAPNIVKGGGMNFSAMISWPWKFIVGDTYISFGAQDHPRDGYWTIKPYDFVAPPEEKPHLPYRLYNLEDDETESHNLAQDTTHTALVKELLEKLHSYAKKENGWRADQFNLPRPLANPRFYNWTWSPFHPFEDMDETFQV
jgi:arylsulfatase A-like enzyme